MQSAYYFLPVLEDRLTVPWILDLVLNFSLYRICLQGGIQKLSFFGSELAPFLVSVSNLVLLA